MASEFNIKVTNSASNALNKFTGKMSNPKNIIALGAVAKSVIVTRTLRGRSVSGAPFVGYSRRPYYAPIDKRPAGYEAPKGGIETKGGKTRFYPHGYGQYHRAYGLGSNVTLSVSNEMLGDIQVVGTHKKAILFFGSRLSAAKAHGHHTGTNPVLPERPFFDLSQDNAKELRAELLKQIKKQAAESGLDIKGGS